MNEFIKKLLFLIPPELAHSLFLEFIKLKLINKNPWDPTTWFRNKTQPQDFQKGVHSGYKWDINIMTFICISFAPPC